MSDHQWTGRKRIGGYTLVADWQPNSRPRREKPVLQITFTRKAAPATGGQSAASCGAKEGRSTCSCSGDDGQQ